MLSDFLFLNNKRSLPIMGFIAALLAMLSYAVGGVIIARKLGNIPPTTLVPIYCSAVALIQVTGNRVITGEFGALSATPVVLWWVLGLIIAFAIADPLYVLALNTVPLPVATTAVATYPIAATMIDKIFFNGTTPSARTLFGMSLAVFAVWLVATDQSKVPITP